MMLQEFGYSSINRRYEIKGVVFQGAASDITIYCLNGRISNTRYEGFEGKPQWLTSGFEKLLDWQVEHVPCKRGEDSDKFSIVENLKQLVQQNDYSELWIITDPDRHGAKIGHDATSLVQSIKPNIVVKRVELLDLSVESMTEAFSKAPSALNENQIAAAEFELEVNFSAGKRA